MRNSSASNSTNAAYINKPDEIESNTPVVINAAGEVGEYNVRIERPVAIPIGVAVAKVTPIIYGRMDLEGKEIVAIRAPSPIPSKVSVN
jgi:hypothetical protein